jgi:PAP2 superfamily
MRKQIWLISFFAIIAVPATGVAQTAANLKAFEGLAPVTTLENSEAGKTALAANLKITGKIQDGSAHQPILLPFAQQQQQALRDAVLTSENAHQLADGLGSKLGGVYQSLASYTTDDGGKKTHAANISPAVADLIVYVSRISNSDSVTSKNFFSNLTQPNHKPVSAEAMAILEKIKGKPDMFGRAYGLPAGAPGGDPQGNPRPFQTDPRVITYRGNNFFGEPTHSITYLQGPAQELRDSPSYPSGHTTYGYTEGLLLAILVPQRYPEMVARAAEYGNDRVILGAHYTMDVLAGRTLAAYDLAQLLANKPNYVGVEQRRGPSIADFQQTLAAAREDITKALEAGCGAKLAACAKQDRSRFARKAKNRAFYESTQTYGLPTVYSNTVGREDVAKIAPEAGNLLTAAFPYLTLDKANAILTATEGPGGGFLDNGSAFGVYSRLDLYRAGEAAIAARPR